MEVIGTCKDDVIRVTVVLSKPRPAPTGITHPTGVGAGLAMEAIGTCTDDVFRVTVVPPKPRPAPTGGTYTGEVSIPQDESVG